MANGSDFDPSLLERKDRSELVAIAESLGGKVPARAKKADIAALILQIVGHQPDSGSNDELVSDDAADNAADTADVVDTVEATGDAEDDDDADDLGSDEASESDSDSTGGSGSDQDDASVGASEGGEGQSTASGSRRGGGRSNAGGRNAAASDPGRQNKGADGDGQAEAADAATAADGANTSEGDNANRGNDDSGQAQGHGGTEEPESANRRRRRRGRDRRDGQDETLAEPVDVEGFVDLRDEGYGFLRVNGYLPSRDDAYVSVKQVRQFGLRRGDVVKGKSRMANRNEKNPALLQIDAINGRPAEADQPERPRFEDLTPLFPDEMLRLEQPEFPENMTARIIDLLAPIGKGQRGLIVSPPKAGKTTVMKQIVRAIERNEPDVHMIVLLVDERPEEVTDFRRWMINGEVAASTFDRPSEEHIAVAELVIDRAKRLVEQGDDVVVVLDGITRLARAYNLAAPTTGRVMAGGIDTGALFPPKKIFGAARNVEEGGSLTILATALVETNTRMDEVIFEEFKGTGNMELKLDRHLAERRIYPAIDVDASSTRHEELLYDRKQLNQIWKLRRVLSALAEESGSNAAGLEMLTDRLRTFRTNEEFLTEVAKS